MPSARPEIDPATAAVLTKVALRIVPILAVLYIVSFLDRVNIGFAALTMNEDLGISSADYGIAAGIFFLGYLLFQAPSNILMGKFGARRWMAVLLVSWGTVSTLMAAVQGRDSLVVMRFLLGIAEAGFFPGCILYLTQWFPRSYQARVVAGFMFGIPIANIIGAPLSGVILDTTDGLLGLADWRWLFILTSLPALVGAIVVLKLLPDNPAQAKWLNDAERDLLAKAVAPSAAAKAAGPVKMGAMAGLIVLLAISYFGFQMGMYGIGLWLPQIVSNSGASDLVTGMLSAVPYVAAIIAMYFWGRFVDRRGASGSSVFIPGAIAAVSLAVSAFIPSFALQFVLLTVLTAGVISALPAFWANASRVLPLGSAAIGIALINSVGNLGGFVGPFSIGWIRDYTDSFQMGLLAVAAAVAISSVTVLLVREHKAA